MRNRSPLVFRKKFLLTLASLSVGVVIIFGGTRLKKEIFKREEFKLLEYYDLPSYLCETSGLIYYNDLVWTFNDSGGEPELYAWSEKKQKIDKRVTLINGFNYDWEDITQDSSFIYIGDIGNNFGNRDNLCIYKIKKKHLLKKGNKAVMAQKITYTYPGYNSNSILKFKRSSFDCEALIAIHDSLYLFTKDWNTHHSRIYSLPTTPGDYTANFIGEFNSKGLITGADYDGKKLILIGYKDNSDFLWVYNDFQGGSLNSKEGRHIILDSFQGAQTEGIAIKDDNIIYISNEKSSVPQRIWKVKLKE
jgi:hypothetical protein